MLESADSTTVVPTPHGVDIPETLTPAEKVKRKPGLSIGAWISIGWLTLVAGAALLAPVLPLKDPNGGRDVDYLNAGKGWFTSGHPLGVDDIGRDVMSRAIWGGRTSLVVAVGSILLGTLIGGLLGLTAGYLGGRTDSALSSGFNILLAFPQLVLALTLVSVLAPTTDEAPATWSKRVGVMILAIGIVSIPILARITRANALVWSQREFVMAARAQGAKSINVMFKEVFPNVLPAILSIALLGIAVVIVIEGSLALFGLSVVLPDSSWGNMIASEFQTVEKQPHVWQAPAIAIFFTVLALNYLGDVVRAKFDVRESAI